MLSFYFQKRQGLWHVFEKKSQLELMNGCWTRWFCQWTLGWIELVLIGLIIGQDKYLANLVPQTTSDNSDNQGIVLSFQRLSDGFKHLQMLYFCFKNWGKISVNAQILRWTHFNKCVIDHVTHTPANRTYLTSPKFPGASFQSPAP